MGTAGGSLADLHLWWTRLVEMGPQNGFFPNSYKSTLLVKPNHLSSAQQIFAAHNIDIVTDDARVLGSPIGTADFTTR